MAGSTPLCYGGSKHHLSPWPSFAYDLPIHQSRAYASSSTLCKTGTLALSPSKDPAWFSELRKIPGDEDWIRFLQLFTILSTSDTAVGLHWPRPRKRKRSSPSPAWWAFRSRNSTSKPWTVSSYQSNHMSPRQPTVEFHMTTRRRSGRVVPPPTVTNPSAPAVSALAPSAQPSPLQATVSPDTRLLNSPDSSSLSTPPSSIGTTPDGLASALPDVQELATDSTSDPTPEPRRSSRARRASYRHESPTRKSGRKRKVSSDEAAGQLTGRPKKARQTGKVSSGKEDETEKSGLWSAPNVQAFELEKAKPAPVPISRSPTKSGRLRETRREDTPEDGERQNKVRPRKEEQSVQQIAPASSSDDSTKKKMKPPNVSDGSHLDFRQRKDKEFWPEFDARNPIYYGADAKTRYKPEGRASPASGAPRKTTRGTAGGRGRGGNGNGVGRGYAKARGNRGRGDSPNPPNRKRPLTNDDRASMNALKARQLELKRFFQIVGAHQSEILDQLAARDLNQLIRKAKAHKQVPEYQDVLDDLAARKEDSVRLARKKLEIQLEHGQQYFAQEQKVIEQKYRTRVEGAKKEHLAGVRGDIVMAQHALTAANDDAHTEVEAYEDYFPQYHQVPEAGTGIRGYNSTRITDETAFRHQITNYDDQVRREVVDDDIISPMVKALEESSKRRREDQGRHQSQNMTSLSAEAVKQLHEINGYLIPKPLKAGEFDSFSLSRLAEVSEWVAQTHPDRQYIFMPLAPHDRFPAQALNFDPLPGQPEITHPLPPPPPPRQTRPGANNPPQFIFHQPQQMSPPSPFITPPVHTPRIPVTFVNQTIASRKAGKSGKGQRLLLPKA